MTSFAHFDRRGYRTVDARTGYGEWAATYDDIVEDEMDVALLDALASVDWPTTVTVADLGCGTGRTAAWLRAKGVQVIDGVDVTPEMLHRAAQRGVHRRLMEAGACASGLETGAYDLVIVSLVDEHIEDLTSLYKEAYRLACSGGTMVLVGYHPQFIMVSGMSAHYNNGSGEPVGIETHVHLISDQVAAALSAGWSLKEMRERVIDDRWIALKPKWEHLRHQPVSFVMVWQRL
jgi:SAM-dependent methyltransferase